MGPFQQLQENPQFHCSSLLPSVTVEWDEAQISLSIDGKDRIEQLTYQTQSSAGEIALYEALARLVQNRSIHQVASIGLKEFDQFFAEDPDYLTYRNDPSRPILTLPLQLFYQALAQYQGKVALPPKDSPLVCRCFAVFEKELIESIKNNSINDLKTLTGTLLAGGGCTSCSEDLQKYITQYAKREASSPWRRASVVMEIHQLFCQWRSAKEMEWDIIDCSQEMLTVIPLGTTSQEDIVIFEQYLKKYYNLKIRVSP